MGEEKFAFRSQGGFDVFPAIDVSLASVYNTNIPCKQQQQQTNFKLKQIPSNLSTTARKTFCKGDRDY